MTGARRPWAVSVGALEARVEPATGWRLTWLDRSTGIARLDGGGPPLGVVVERAGRDWAVTLHGRRITVTVRDWREQVLAEASGTAARQAGALEVRATLPGLVVAVQAEEGSEVQEGDPLLRIEAMKMQNELRAPRHGLVAAILVAAGQTVSAGQVLLRLE